MTATAENIEAAMRGEKTSFAELARRIYTDDKAWRRPARGGPPGCYMALSAALRRHGYLIDYKGKGPGNRFVYPRRPQPL